MAGSGGGLVPGATYTLKLGSTWDHIPTDLIHAVQYDFKPASVDPSQPGQMKLDGNNGVCVILPHRDTDECSEFKGNKQSTSKECFLVIDKEQNTVYLEKVSNMIRVKKHRSVKKKTARKESEDRSSPILQQPKDSPTTTHDTPPPPPPPPKSEPEPSNSESSSSQPKPKRLKQSAVTAASSGNLSSDSSASDSDSSTENSDSDARNPDVTTAAAPVAALTLASSSALITPLGEPPVAEDVKPNAGLIDMLSQDLDLSDSDSD